MDRDKLSKFDQYYRPNHPAFWLAVKHHRNHKGEKINLETHPYQYAMLLDDAPEKICKKSTQGGVSEILGIWAMAKAIIRGRSVFGVLPNGKLVKRWVQNRLNKSLKKTPYYKAVQTLIKKEGDDVIESIQLKDVGPGVISVNSSETEDAFAEFPGDDGFIDELDYCNQENLQMFPERFAHATDPTFWKIGNPTQLGIGIDKEYQESDQRKWYIRHSCGNWLTPDWFDHVVRQVDDIDYVLRDPDWTWDSPDEIKLICDKCGNPFSARGKGLWVPAYKTREKHGYEFSKLISGTTSIQQLMERFSEGLKNETILQRFYNGDLGLARTAADSKITDDLLRSCLGDYGHKTSSISGPSVMGIDVGKVLNVIISRIRRMETGEIKLIVTHILEVPSSIKEIGRLIKENNVKIAVIDGMPELKLARDMKKAFKNMFACFYHEQPRDRPREDRVINVNRTATLDDVMGGFQLGDYVLPADAETISAFFKQMTAANRILDLKANFGEGVYRWVEAGPDHYFHAFNYMVLAAKLLVLHTKK